MLKFSMVHPAPLPGSLELKASQWYELEARHLAPATINLRLAAVRRLVYEASGRGLLNSDLATGIRRVKGAKRLGIRMGNCLTVGQVKKLFAVKPESLYATSEIMRFVSSPGLLTSLTGHQLSVLRNPAIKVPLPCPSSTNNETNFAAGR
jgi:hypothetical protein